MTCMRPYGHDFKCFIKSIRVCKYVTHSRLHATQVEQAIAAQLTRGAPATQPWTQPEVDLKEHLDRRLQPFQNALLSITCLLSNLRQAIEHTQQLQLVAAIRTVPDSSAPCVASSGVPGGGGSKKFKRKLKSIEKYGKRLRAHVAATAGNAQSLEQLQDREDAENQPPVTSSGQEQASSEQLHATACQSSDRPPLASILAAVPAVSAPTTGLAASPSAEGPIAPLPSTTPAAQHWDVSYHLHAYWKETYPSQPSWLLVVPGHPQSQDEGSEPWASWGGPLWKSVSGKKLQVQASFAVCMLKRATRPSCLSISDYNSILDMVHEWRYGVQLVKPGDGRTAKITPPLWLLEKHFVTNRGWRTGSDMRTGITKRKVMVYAIMRRMCGLADTPHSRMSEHEALQEVKTLAKKKSIDGIYKALSQIKETKEMTPGVHEGKWGFAWPS
jgi:Transcriptional activator of glycolytic enzymes